MAQLSVVVGRPVGPSISGRATDAESARRRPAAFRAGTALVAIGTILHIPMYVQARDMHYKLAGMSMDPEMVIGMIAIVLGLMLAGDGVLPPRAPYGPAARLRGAPLD